MVEADKKYPSPAGIFFSWGRIWGGFALGGVVTIVLGITQHRLAESLAGVGMIVFGFAFALIVWIIVRKRNTNPG